MRKKGNTRLALGSLLSDHHRHSPLGKTNGVRSRTSRCRCDTDSQTSGYLGLLSRLARSRDSEPCPKRHRHTRTLWSSIRGKQIAFELRLDPDVQINGVKGEIRQVISNLLVNALEAMETEDEALPFSRRSSNLGVYLRVLSQGSRSFSLP